MTELTEQQLALLRRQDILRDLSTPRIANFSWVPCAPIKYEGMRGPNPENYMPISRVRTRIGPVTLAALSERLGPPMAQERAYRAPDMPAKAWWWYAAHPDGRRWGIYMAISAKNGEVYGGHVAGYANLEIDAHILAYQAHLRLEALFGK